jgi:plastocyanin
MASRVAARLKPESAGRVLVMDRTYVVTGATSGIGAATARYLRKKAGSYRDERMPVSGRARRAGSRAMLVGAVAAIGMSVAVAAWVARQPTTIRMEDTPLGGIYDPAKLTVPVGTTVQWKNYGQQVHDATDLRDAALRASDAAYPSGAEPFDSGDMQPGQTFSYTFTVPGTYKYFCIPHEFGGMTGEVIVTE